MYGEGTVSSNGLPHNMSSCDYGNESNFYLNPNAPSFNYHEEPGPSQNNFAENLNRNNGAIKKKYKPYNNIRRNDQKYGSGRIFNNYNREFRDGNFFKNTTGKYEENHGANYGAKRDPTKIKKNSKSHYREPFFNNNFRNHKNYDKNWRRNGDESSMEKVKKKLDSASQRERLEQMLSQRILECLVCCEKIKHTDKIWSCEQCYLILHLNCTSTWAKSSKLETGWRCPACQYVTNEIPQLYKCYCGKTVEPRPMPGVTPHSCGDVCMQPGRFCQHKCMILCHPGPCPDCNVMVNKQCGCGATIQTIKCSNDTNIVCEEICNKLLNCALHYCTEKCHKGSCNICLEQLEQICFCGKTTRKVKCSIETSQIINFTCESKCGKLLSCNNHYCLKICHDGDCGKCERDVELIKTCPCGKMPLNEKRTTCLDLIPCCNKICGKALKCGQPHTPHTCQQKCHENVSCPPCPLTTFVRCRCGHMDKELSCVKLTTKADDARCEKKCTKKRLCGKHKCNQRCCIEIKHICPLPCNRLLACGKHRCQLTCHNSRCPACIETSFEELFCECGSSVLFPPIPCGTKPPICNKPCSRQRSCGHDVNHTCHIGPCTPCTVLCKRWCYGKHEQRSAIPCHQEDFSCGLPCNKPMPCANHKCIKPCHLNDCPLPCRQPCNVKRSLCGHPCNASCHYQTPSCPDTQCRFVVPVTCQCGLLKSTRICIELIDEYKQLEMANLKEKMGDLLKEQSMDISDFSKVKKPSILKILECTEECRVFERNRRLAIGLQIRNPELSQKLTPRYSDFMRNWAKKDAYFCQRIHDKLTELVQLAKQSKQKSRSYSFESMNRDKRTFVHEYCEHFGCESAAYDAEPNRNVVATAIRDKSWLPSMSLLEVIQRENGQRKVPGPVLGGKSLVKTESSVSLKVYKKLPSTPPEEKVDYFDNPPV